MWYAAALVLGVVLVGVGGQNDCKTGPPPQGNCPLPNCRCAYDGATPGSFSKDDTPQMILVTFENAINEGNVVDYTDLFTTTNPNNCPGRGTFFIQDQYSDAATILDLYSKGHEIGAHSFNDSFPQDGASTNDWKAVLSGVHKTLTQAGIKSADIKGVRGPRLTAGGSNQFTAMAETKFIYDATCATDMFIDEGTIKWPYTYDYVPAPKCTIGQAPDILFPGKWQFLVADLVFNGTKCASPSACTKVASQKDAFDLFYDSFVKHYDGNRAPYMIVINPEWVTEDYKKAGTIQFLEYVRAAFEDTWILTVSQALAWMQTPTPKSNITQFQPWQC